MIKIDERLKDLIEETLGLFLWKWLTAFGPHVLFEIELKVLEDKIELFL